jgi:hypothetical protein
VFLATGIGSIIMYILASCVTECILKVFVLNIITATLKKLIILSYIAIFLILTILDVY